MEKIRKAVFPVAGFGTRFLPATKAMPKELLPIVDKPLIQYAVEEAVDAGIDTLIFITGRNKRAIEDHFDANYELEMELRTKGNEEKADLVRNILPKNVQCLFVRQAKQLGLGHAVLCAERAVGNEPFAVLLADDFLTNQKVGTTKELINSFNQTGKPQLSVMEVDSPEICKYGVVIPSKVGREISGIVEKPKLGEAPSNLASIGRYVLTPDIFKILNRLPVGLGGEFQLADAINVLAQDREVEIVKLKGKRFDCGSVEGFVSACVYEFENR